MLFRVYWHSNGAGLSLFGGVDFREGCGTPDNHFVRRPGNDGVVVEEEHGVGAGEKCAPERREFLLSGQIIEFDRTITIAGRQALTIGRKGRCKHARELTAQLDDFAVRGQVPDSSRPVKAGRDQESCIRREGQTRR